LKLGINISEEIFRCEFNLHIIKKYSIRDTWKANDDDGVEPPYIRTTTVDVHYTYNQNLVSYLGM
jgi:hypothetical protein